MHVSFELNGGSRAIDLDPDMPLLWVLRDILGLTGAKYGCGIGACGSCTVRLDGKAIRACDTPIRDVAGRHVTTIEGFASDMARPLIRAWLDEDVPQCGYCQTGQIMSAAALLEDNLAPSDAEIDVALANNICRCGAYQRIRSAIHKAAQAQWTEIDDSQSPLPPPITPFEPSIQLNPWIKIGADNTVTVMISKADMGQGVRTALAMLAAEELEADWSQVRVEQAPLDEVYGDQATVGSTSMMRAWEPLRAAGASARERLIAAAAQIWDVDRQECEANAGKVVHRPSQRSVAFSDVAEVAATLPEPTAPSFKSADDYTIIGKPTSRIDNPAVIAGTAQFGQDVRLPGMLYAVVARCPVYGGQLTGFDAAAAKNIPGVEAIFPIQSGIAVVAQTTWAAMTGRDALNIIWDEGENQTIDDNSMRTQLEQALPTAYGAAAEGVTVVEATYELPLLAHAALEPLTCVADVSSDRCEIWIPGQIPGLVRTAVATATGLTEDAVTVHQTLLGGGFGRKAHSDAAVEAAQISQEIDAPVQVIWSRQDDIQHDRYRPPSMHALRALLDTDRQISAWSHTMVTDGMLDLFPREFSQDWAEESAMPPYSIPKPNLDITFVDLPLQASPWRSVFRTQAVFANECFMDELAYAMDRDPFELRRELASHPRLRHVLELAAERAGWQTPRKAGFGRGIACFAGLGSYIASVVELTIQGSEIRVLRVVCAVDCGIPINPRTIEAQVQGGAVDGLATALKAKITVADGRVQQSSFQDFEWMRMGDMPHIDTIVVQSMEPPGGLGELGYPPIPPAVANALFDLASKRVRRLPIQLKIKP